MSIVVKGIEITGLNEALIRDNVIDPDTELVERALQDIIGRYRGASLSRAEAAYQAAYRDNPGAQIPNFLDKDAVLEWYFATEAYKDATIRQAEQNLARVTREKALLETDRERLVTKVAGFNDKDTETYKASVTAQLADVGARIAELNLSISQASAIINGE